MSMENKYYKTNALYEYIKDHNIQHLEYVAGNLWMLIYGDSQCDPHLLVTASGVPQDEIYSELSKEEKRIHNRMIQLYKRTKIPSIFIRFAINTDSIDEVLLFNKEHKFVPYTMDKLTEIFAHFGLPTAPYKSSKTAKYLNDKTSSAYHKWQRDNLGRDLKVSDFDLLKVDKDGNIEEVYELKRSYYSLDRWKPFQDDYNNFRLLLKLLSKDNIKLKIVYNVRTKNPFFDDISKLKIFNVNEHQNPLITYDKIVDIDTFIKEE